MSDAIFQSRRRSAPVFAARAEQIRQALLVRGFCLRAGAHADNAWRGAISSAGVAAQKVDIVKSASTTNSARHKDDTRCVSRGDRRGAQAGLRVAHLFYLADAKSCSLQGRFHRDSVRDADVEPSSRGAQVVGRLLLSVDARVSTFVYEATPEGSQISLFTKHANPEWGRRSRSPRDSRRAEQRDCAAHKWRWMSRART